MSFQTFLTSGNIGIGTTNPSYKLDVNGTLRALGGDITLGSLLITNINSSNISTNTLIVNGGELSASWNSNTIANIFTTGGNVGINTTNPVSTLDINGNTSINGTLICTGDITAFGSISDIRLKTDIKSLSKSLNTNSLEIINSLNPITFKWKDDIFNESKRNKDDVGFIAQEIEKIIPYAVDEFQVKNNDTFDTYKNIKHERIIPYLVSSIQELNIIVKKLEKKNITLERNLNKLKLKFE